jgi:RecA-family ATPase
MLQTWIAWISPGMDCLLFRDSRLMGVFMFHDVDVDILWCFSSEPPEMDFVLPGFLAGTVGCLAAAGSTGKSFWALEASMGVASAEADQCLLGLGPRHHGRVLILNAEDPHPVVHQRLHSIGTFLPQGAREEVAEKLSVQVLAGTQTNIMDVKWQDAILRAAEGVRLVVFDTLSRWHRLDENDNGQMAHVVSMFEMIARKTGASVLFLHHVAKAMARDGRQGEQQATRGASSITDNARWQGWMQSMGVSAAKEFDIQDGDRWRYVQAGANKENYGQSSPERWLERRSGGVLIPVELHKQQTNGKAKGGSRDRDKA